MRRTLTAVLIAAAITATTTPTEAMTSTTDTEPVAGVLLKLQAENAKLHRHVTWYERKIRKLKDKIAELQPEPVAPEPVAPAPASLPSYSGGVLSAEQVASYARGAGFPESVVSTMVAIAYRESRFNPNAINSSSGACGLWQLFPCYGGSAWLNPATNAAKAFEKYQAGGLAPWGG